MIVEWATNQGLSWNHFKDKRLQVLRSYKALMNLKETLQLRADRSKAFILWEDLRMDKRRSSRRITHSEEGRIMIITRAVEAGVDCPTARQVA
jgi:hypothetical protein